VKRAVIEDNDTAVGIETKANRMKNL